MNNLKTLEQTAMKPLQTPEQNRCILRTSTSCPCVRNLSSFNYIYLMAAAWRSIFLSFGGTHRKGEKRRRGRGVSSLSEGRYSNRPLGEAVPFFFLCRARALGLTSTFPAAPAHSIDFAQSNTDVDAEELSNAVRSTLEGKPRIPWEEGRRVTVRT